MRLSAPRPAKMARDKEKRLMRRAGEPVLLQAGTRK